MFQKHHRPKLASATEVEQMFQQSQHYTSAFIQYFQRGADHVEVSTPTQYALHIPAYHFSETGRTDRNVAQDTNWVLSKLNIIAEVDKYIFILHELLVQHLPQTKLQNRHKSIQHSAESYFASWVMSPLFFPHHHLPKQKHVAKTSYWHRKDARKAFAAIPKVTTNKPDYEATLYRKSHEAAIASVWIDMFLEDSADTLMDTLFRTYDTSPLPLEYETLQRVAPYILHWLLSTAHKVATQPAMMDDIPFEWKHPIFVNDMLREVHDSQDSLARLLYTAAVAI